MMNLWDSEMLIRLRQEQLERDSTHFWKLDAFYASRRKSQWTGLLPRILRGLVRVERLRTFTSRK
ncbi:hypothetical protein [Alicyclobacillus dauci]|uniref:Uncharacterized protein n=1 Tax=Alicyclobacillus dauci TaxID=1475485 RepID=A0ABY6Z629_9BACL|nr:hypothetical protein [Alicyclobacillus dauci]WAH38344.1 hypothetical protein NZD86_07665 [Alicyclobacillus dauci]